jgi:uracil-DNA glycosylase
MNINQVLILLGEYVVKFHLAESRAETLEAELEQAKATIEEQGIRLANAYEVMGQVEGGADGVRTEIATPR